MRVEIILGVGALVASACTSSSDTAETVYDPCSPLRVALASSATADEIAGVDAAVAGWAAQLPTRLTRSVADESQAPDVLPIKFIHGSGTRAAYWDHVGTITVNVDELAPAELPAAIAHELGHAFGLLHITERVSVMNIGNTTQMPTDEDATDVAAFWAACTR